MKRYVIDASVAVKWYIPEPLSDPASRYLKELKERKAVLTSPDLIIAEIGNVVWKKLKNEELSLEESRMIADALSASFPAELCPASELIPAALEIAAAIGLTVYDSLYLALAVSSEAVLVTADKELAQSASGASIFIVQVELLR